MPKPPRQLDSRIEIVTPENIAFEYVLAGPFRRLPAFLVDVFIRAVVLFIVLVSCMALHLIGGLSIGIGIFLVVWFGMSWFYGGLFETLWNGQTPGKRLFRLRVLGIDGQPINAMQAVLRNVLRDVDALPMVGFGIPLYILGLAAMTANNRFQRLGDWTCGTIVVVEKRVKPPSLEAMNRGEVIEFAQQLPVNFVASRAMSKALSVYVARRGLFAPARRFEIARTLAEPLCVRWGLPADTNPDLFLCALYYRAFIADRPGQERPGQERPGAGRPGAGGGDQRMKVALLLERRREQWRDLEQLCQEIERRGARRAGAQAVSRFAGLYRSACADLALADAYQLPADTVEYLHQLVGRAHNQLYRSRTFRWREWGHTMFVELPGRLLYDRAMWLAMATFWGIFFLTLFLAFTSPKFTRGVVGEAAMANFKEMYSHPTEGRSSGAGSFMTGFYVSHNAGIGLRCFAAGLILGIGGLFALVFNAMQLGAVFGYMLTIPQRENFMQFVTAHGPFELTAIVFSAAAGMRMGFSLISTGGLSRVASLRRGALEAAPMIGASVILFCLAAIIEGFVSPSALPYAVKAGVAIFSSALLLFYVVGLGYAHGR